MKKFIIILTIPLLLFSCKQESKVLVSNEVPKYNIVNSEKGDNQSILSVIDTFKFVKLEVSSDYPLGTVDKVIGVDGMYIILDGKSHSVFYYCRDGGFINCIRKRGKGEGEYYRIADMVFDAKSRTIVLKDNFMKKMIYYDLKGDFVKEVKFPGFALNFDILDNGLVACFNPRSSLYKKDFFQLFYFNDKGKMISKLLPFSPQFSKDQVVISTYFFHNDSSKFVFAPYSNTIYQLDNEGVSPAYQIDFGEANLPVGHHWREKAFDYTNYAQVYSIQENSKHISLSYTFGLEKSIRAKIDKRTGRVIKLCIKDQNIQGQTDKLFYGKEVGVCDDYFVHSKDTYTFFDSEKNSRALNFFLEKHDLSELSVLDNPVLVFVKYKDL